MPLSFADSLQVRGAHALLRVPPSLLRRLAGPPVLAPEGYALDPQVQLMLRLRGIANVPETYELPLPAARQNYERANALVAPRWRPGLEVWDEALSHASHPSPVAARVYRPARRPKDNPVLVFFHGGGFVLGTLDAYDGLCRRIALDAGCMVVSVDYRLAPEHVWPAAIDDSLAATRAVFERCEELGGRPDRVALGGDSAGGNLAAIVCHDLRDAPASHPVIAQWLIYPATDLSRSMPSHKTLGDGPFLPTRTLDWFMGRYVPDPARYREPRASPLFYDDYSRLPAALVMTAGFDPLRDEGEAYAEKLRAAGVAVELQREETLPHGFAAMTGLIDRADEAMTLATDRLRGMLSP